MSVEWETKSSPSFTVAMTFPPDSDISFHFHCPFLGFFFMSELTWAKGNPGCSQGAVKEAAKLLLSRSLRTKILRPGEEASSKQKPEQHPELLWRVSLPKVAGSLRALPSSENSHGLWQVRSLSSVLVTFLSSCIVHVCMCTTCVHMHTHVTVITGFHPQAVDYCSPGRAALWNLVWENPFSPPQTSHIHCLISKQVSEG